MKLLWIGKRSWWMLKAPCCCWCLVAHHVQLLVTPWTIAARLLCPWAFPSRNTGVDFHFLLQRIFPTQGSNLRLLHCRWILYQWATREARKHLGKTIILAVAKSQLEKAMAPTPVLLPGKSNGWRSLEGCSPCGHWGSDTTERLHFHFSLSCIGEGNGSLLHCSCLENPRDRGAWWAAIYGVAQSWTWLKWLIREKEPSYTVDGNAN